MIAYARANPGKISVGTTMNQALQEVPVRKTESSDGELAQQWLSALEAALNSGNAGAVAALFTQHDWHWRDLLAFTWHITPHRGAKEIGAALVAGQSVAKARGFALAEGRTRRPLAAAWAC